MAEEPPLRFGPKAKAASELTDSELERELHARRLKRARGADAQASLRRHTNSDEIARFFANLELPPDACIADVHAAYDRLLAKYEPYTAHADPERSRAARALLESLERAYRGLLTHLDPGP